MALLLYQYSDFFLVDPENPSEDMSSRRYFDPVQREFLIENRDNLSERSRLIEVPVLNLKALYCTFLRMYGYTRFLAENEGKSDAEFMVAARWYLDKCDNDYQLASYIGFKLDEHMYKWAVDNHIENWKLHLDPCELKNGPVTREEMSKAFRAHNVEQLKIEAEDEERFKVAKRECLRAF